MTTLPLVSAGAGAPTLPDAGTHTDTAPHADTLLARADADAQRGSGDALALFTASHDMHPLARQQQQQFVGHGAQAGGAQKATACKVPNAATSVWNVKDTTQTQIDALKKSCDPQERSLGRTIEHAKAAYGDLLSKGAQIVVTLNAGNGGEPVMTLKAPGFDANVPARIHTHYHGDNATVGDPEGSKAGQNSRIRETWKRDPQMVFVLPECHNVRETVDSPQNNLEYPANWGNVKSQAQTTDLALAAGGITKIEKETGSVHSRGGTVIEKLMKDDPSGKSLRADRLELHDSLYGSQGSVVRWGKTDNGRQVEKVIYVHGNNGGIHGDGRDREIAKTFKGSYIRIDICQPSKGGECKTTPHEDKNDDKVRKYHPDPHYQTTGRFLAIWPLPN